MGGQTFGKQWTQTKEDCKSTPIPSCLSGLAHLYRRFLNRVSNASQSELPPQCYGGIVADPMGLGKTLTMIALVATDLENSGDMVDTDEGCHLDVPATLIVVPPPCKMLNVFSSSSLS